MKKILKYILLICLFPTFSFGSTQLFSDGFESGDTSNWNTATSGVNVQTSIKRSGSDGNGVPVYHDNSSSDWCFDVVSIDLVPEDPLAKSAGVNGPGNVTLYITD